MTNQLEFRTVPAPKGRDSRYNGIDCMKLYAGEKHWGTVWQSIGGFNWTLIYNEGDWHAPGPGGTCENLEDGCRKVVNAYWALIEDDHLL